MMALIVEWSLGLTAQVPYLEMLHCASIFNCCGCSYNEFKRFLWSDTGGDCFSGMTEDSNLHCPSEPLPGWLRILKSYDRPKQRTLIFTLCIIQLFPDTKLTCHIN